MRNFMMVSLAVALWGAALNGATEGFPSEPPEVIEIEVPEEDLERCRRTLAQVARIPVVHDGRLAILSEPTGGGPLVRCVVEDS